MLNYTEYLILMVKPNEDPLGGRVRLRWSRFGECSHLGLSLHNGTFPFHYAVRGIALEDRDRRP
jgi:hypothetical protein